MRLYGASEVANNGAANPQMTDLGTIGGATGNFFAEAVTPDGTVVVGASVYPGSGGNRDAFYWTQALGMQDLNTLLKNAGVNVTGIDLINAAGVSGARASSPGAGGRLRPHVDFHAAFPYCRPLSRAHPWSRPREAHLSTLPPRA